jgi:hypothetical protein
MQIINGKWSINAYGDPMTTTEHGNEFMDKLVRIRSYSNGRRLTSNKIKILFSILDSNSITDGALAKLLSMNTDQIKKLF